MSKVDFMKKAIDIAYDNVKTNHGGPFGALVVKDGIIIGVGRNEVTAVNDPTAHAEVQAIRAACQYLSNFQLTDCDIYTSCEPCPMCIGAIYWARPRAVYYACTKEDAAKIGFDDQFIYEQLELPNEQRKIAMKQFSLQEGDLPFRTWESSKMKIEY
ncbi:nucleoside deaminase [Bacillus sp. BRMEA1]|uniref:nucleoside deaminase n=1 Tax=Neobacillus endophyticus TaxID=2738405 RepID=UPI0015633F44|nr:nucleoside deaminase [Neobacillus endophyticus]NRD77950.1 nucleoside deaminase [Neobacillus endophyticus]